MPKPFSVSAPIPASELVRQPLPFGPGFKGVTVCPPGPAHGSIVDTTRYTLPDWMQGRAKKRPSLDEYDGNFSG